jgi:hypothetical protein
MVALIFLFFTLVASLFKSKSRLEAENAALRHQLTVLRRQIRGRVQFTNGVPGAKVQIVPRSLHGFLAERPESLDTVLAFLRRN